MLMRSVAKAAMALPAMALVLCTASVLVLCTASVQAEETLRAVSGLTRNNPSTKLFLKYVADVNKQAKGLVRIKFVGGPEVSKAREQALGLKNGVFHLMFGPPTFYAGLFPESALFYTLKSPLERRASGGTDLLDQVYRKKLNAHFLGHFGGAVKMYLWLREKPKFTASGSLDLRGLKVRSSPIYRHLITSLGGTVVVMRLPKMYTAFERGVIDGTGSPIRQIAVSKVSKFVRYQITPPFSGTGLVAVVNATKFNSLPKAARNIMEQTAIRYERETFQSSAEVDRKKAAKMYADGMQRVELKGQARNEFLDTMAKGMWARLKANPKVILDIDKVQDKM